MDIQIEGRHLKVTEAIQEHVHKKIDNLDKYFDGINNLHVILTVEDSKRQLAEIVCTVVRGQPIVARAAHEDMYIAIDQAVHKIREHLKKHKARLRDRRHSERMKAPLAEGPAESAESADGEP